MHPDRTTAAEASVNLCLGPNGDLDEVAVALARARADLDDDGQLQLAERLNAKLDHDDRDGLRRYVRDQPAARGILREHGEQLRGRPGGLGAQLERELWHRACAPWIADPSRVLAVAAGDLLDAVGAARTRTHEAIARRARSKVAAEIRDFRSPLIFDRTDTAIFDRTHRAAPTIEGGSTADAAHEHAQRGLAPADGHASPPIDPARGGASGASGSGGSPDRRADEVAGPRDWTTQPSSWDLDAHHHAVEDEPAIVPPPAPRSRESAGSRSQLRAEREIGWAPSGDAVALDLGADAFRVEDVEHLADWIGARGGHAWMVVARNPEGYLHVHSVVDGLHPDLVIAEWNRLCEARRPTAWTHPLSRLAGWVNYATDGKRNDVETIVRAKPAPAIDLADERVNAELDATEEHVAEGEPTDFAGKGPQPDEQLREPPLPDVRTAKPSTIQGGAQAAGEHPAIVAQRKLAAVANRQAAAEIQAWVRRLLDATRPAAPS